MLKRCVLVLWLAGIALAQAPPKKIAMVLSAQGNPDVSSGQLWSVGDHITMPAGSKLTVLLLNRGERVELSGQGGVQVAASGLLLKGTRSTPLASAQVRLALNGENQRQIGGFTLRHPAPNGVWDSPLDRVGVSPKGVTVSQPAGAGSPPPLQFYYLAPEEMPTPAEDFPALAASPAPSKSIFMTQVTGRKVGSRWQWQAAWPLEETPRPYSLRIFDGPKLLLWTRLYSPAPGDAKALPAVREQVRQWSRREPKSAEPWIYLATVLEDRGRLEEALSALKSAQTLRPAEKGLAATKMRLLLDLGRYKQAFPEP